MERIAKVINNNSTESQEAVENGSVQVYIEFLMQDIEKDMYPWVFQNAEWTSNIPEIGEYVWVEFLDEENWRNGYYGNKVTLRDYHEHNETIGSMSGNYPNIKYIKLANGVSIALNSSETEVTIVAGDAEIYIDPDGIISIQGGSGTLEFSILGETLKAWLEAHIHPTGVGPSGVATTAGTLNTILSTSVKNS
ncbi:MAG: hypothetical protein GY853_09795 [PVC group bacterium]|nr:hypothetical protein [PVC group bacterium]